MLEACPILDNNFCWSCGTYKPTIWDEEGKKQDYCCSTSLHYRNKVHWADPGWMPAVPEAFLSIPTGCREISALVPGTPPPSHSSLTLLSAEPFPLCTLSYHSCCLLCRWGFFIPFLKMLSQRHYHHCWWVSRSILEPNGIGFIRHSGSLAASHRNSPAVLQLPKPHCANPTHEPGNL